MSKAESTSVVCANSKYIERAAEILLAGGLVAFPTETVYGLGALATDDQAISRLFSAKGRPAEHPVIVHIGSVDGLEGWGRSITQSAYDLAEAFWPGPLTLVVSRSPGVSDKVTGGQDTVGVRVPSHPVAQDLLRSVGEAIAAPSANRFGRISPTLAQHVFEDLDGKIDLILDSGASKLGLESTIIDVRGPRPRLLRPGLISAEDVIGVLGTRPLPYDGATTRAPGLLARHYAPNTPARLLSREEILMLEKGSRGLGVLSRENSRTRFLGDWRVMPQDPINYGEQLYANLRNLDREGIVEILIENVPDEAAWAAIYDRLARATRR